MTHLWVRAEQRENEDRVGITPEGAKALMDAGYQVTVEDSANRAISTDGYRAAGCTIAKTNSWPDAPRDAIIFGLKELPEDGTPLHHRHIMFGHAWPNMMCLWCSGVPSSGSSLRPKIIASRGASGQELVLAMVHPAAR